MGGLLLGKYDGIIYSDICFSFEVPENLEISLAKVDGKTLSVLKQVPLDDGFALINGVIDDNDYSI